MRIDRVEAKTIVKAIKRRNEFMQAYKTISVAALVALSLCYFGFLDLDTFAYVFVPVVILTNFGIPLFFEGPSYRELVLLIEKKISEDPESIKLYNEIKNIN